MWSRQKLDAELLKAMKLVPYENGHWKLEGRRRPR